MRLRRLLPVTAAALILPLALPQSAGPLAGSSAVAAPKKGAKARAKPKPAPASAPKPAAKPDYAKAKAHYAKAEAAAAKQKWDEAAKEYGVAYEISRDPVLFFRLGNAYQLSGDCTRAVEYFERYLAEANPSAEYKADTASRIANCKRSVQTAAAKDSATQESGDAEAGDSATGNRPLQPTLTEANAANVTGTGDDLAGPEEPREIPPSFMDEEVSWQQTAGWTSVGVSVAFLTASAVLGLSASSREEDIENLLSYRDASGRPASFDQTISERYKNLEDEGETLNTLSMVALGGAGLSAAAAIVFFVLDGAPEDDESLSAVTPTLQVSPTGESSVGVRWSF